MNKLNSSSPKKDCTQCKVKLWEHQKAMLYECLNIEKKTNTRIPIGIIADKPGTGKTFVVLSIILSTISNAPINLIIVPQNIYTQWDNSIKQFFDLSKINYKSFTNYSDISSLYSNTNVLNSTNVILTTSLYYHLVSGIINNLGIKLNRVFFDEIDSISNTLRQPIKTDMTWFVSASFDVNKVGCYQPYLENLNGIVCMCEEELIQKSISLENPIEHQIECYNIVIELILDILPKETISELNALDYNTNIYKFTSKVPKNEKEFLEYLLLDIQEIIKHHSNNINSLLASKKEVETCGFYENELLTQKINAIKNQIINSNSIISGVSNLKKQIYEKLKLNKICPITFNTLDKSTKLVSKCCGIAYDKQFINKNISCCLCEKNIAFPSGFLEERILLKRNNKSVNEVYKIDVFKELSLKLKDDKTIIFSDYPFIFREIEHYFKEMNIHYTTLDSGSLDALDKSIEQYKLLSSNFLLVDSSLNGCGMNLENTDNIIFIHKTKEELEKQVIGRCLRPGRKTTLQIYRLLHKNEILS